EARMINLLDGSGRHLVDPGPTFNVHLPIFEEHSGVKTKLNELEFGKELQFFAMNGAKQSAGDMIDGKSTDRYEVSISGSRLVLWRCEIQEACTYKPNPGRAEAEHRLPLLRRCLGIRSDAISASHRNHICGLRVTGGWGRRLMRKCFWVAHKQEGKMSLGAA